MLLLHQLMPWDEHQGFFQLCMSQLQMHHSNFELCAMAMELNFQKHCQSFLLSMSNASQCVFWGMVCVALPHTFQNHVCSLIDFAKPNFFAWVLRTQARCIPQSNKVKSMKPSWLSLMNRGWSWFMWEIASQAINPPSSVWGLFCISVGNGPTTLTCSLITCESGALQDLILVLRQSWWTGWKANSLLSQNMILLFDD